MKRRLAASILVAALESLSACRRVEPPQSMPPAGEVWLTPQQVQGARLVIAPVERRILALHLKTTGRVAFDEGRIAHVFSPVSGRVTKVEAEFGSRVEAGQTLAVIESPDLGSAWSDLVKARADLAAAEHENQRERELFEVHAAAERDAESAADNDARARAECQRAELRLRMFHAPLTGPATQEYTLRSPIAGEVVNRTATPGLEVQGMLSSASIAPELFTVGSIDDVWIWGDLFEDNLAAVHPGQKVTIASVAYPGELTAGAVDYIAAVLDPQSHTARFRCRIPNPARNLKPEMYVTISIELSARRRIAVPRSAVLMSAGRPRVFRQDGVSGDGRIRFLQIPVETGDGDDGWISVTGGLNEGDRIVVSGGILLSSTS